MLQAPVTQLAWQCAHLPELETASAAHPETALNPVPARKGGSGDPALLSLCGAGKLLRWELRAGCAYVRVHASVNPVSQLYKFFSRFWLLGCKCFI